MAVEGLDNFARLDAHCLPSMRPEFKRVLVLSVEKSTAEIAQIEHAKGPTIKAWLRIARSDVALALEHGEDLTPGLCGYWVAKHSVDCLKDTVDELRGVL